MSELHLKPGGDCRQRNQHRQESAQQHGSISMNSELQSKPEMFSTRAFPTELLEKPESIEKRLLSPTSYLRRVYLKASINSGLQTQLF